MQQAVERVLDGFLAALLCLLVQAQWQAGDGLRDHPHTGIDR